MKDLGTASAAPDVPLPVAGVDVMSLPLSTMEAFVLSRVDGVTSLLDIAVMSGLAPAELLAILERLAALGAIRLGGRRESGDDLGRSSPEETGGAASRLSMYDDPSVPPGFDLAELDADADIDYKTRRRILNAFYMLQDRTFYELLGVSGDADKRTIRNAYFDLAKTFHPDALYGRALGPYRSKMEIVFRRLTEGYEVLSRKRRRAEYDAYLASIDRPPVDPRFAAPLPPGNRAVTGSGSTPIPSSDSPAPGSVSTPARSAAPAPSGTPARASVPSWTAAEGSEVRPPPRPAPPARAPKTREERRAQRAQRVRHRFTALGSAVPASPSQPHEVRRNGPANAARRDATSNHPAEAGRRDSTATGPRKAPLAPPKRDAGVPPEGAHAAARAAAALLEGGSDLHRARTYAESAVRLRPNDVYSLCVLAQVHLAAGQKNNARQVLQKAVQLEPGNGLVRELLRKAR